MKQKIIIMLIIYITNIFAHSNNINNNNITVIKINQILCNILLNKENADIVILNPIKIHKPQIYKNENHIIKQLITKKNQIVTLNIKGKKLRRIIRLTNHPPHNNYTISYANHMKTQQSKVITIVNNNIYKLIISKNIFNMISFMSQHNNDNHINRLILEKSMQHVYPMRLFNVLTSVTSNFKYNILNTNNLINKSQNIYSILYNNYKLTNYHIKHPKISWDINTCNIGMSHLRSNKYLHILKRYISQEHLYLSNNQLRRADYNNIFIKFKTTLTHKSKYITNKFSISLKYNKNVRFGYYKNMDIWNKQDARIDQLNLNWSIQFPTKQYNYKYINSAHITPMINITYATQLMQRTPKSKLEGYYSVRKKFSIKDKKFNFFAGYVIDTYNSMPYIDLGIIANYDLHAKIIEYALNVGSDMHIQYNFKIFSIPISYNGYFQMFIPNDIIYPDPGEFRILCENNFHIILAQINNFSMSLISNNIIAFSKARHYSYPLISSRSTLTLSYET